jgi:small subunit ribosomal protein S6
MQNYEVMVIFDPSVEDKSVAPSVDTYLKVITEAGGTVDKVDIWGRRRMTYEIKKHSEGIYAVINLTSGYEAVVELDRQLKLSESVLRTKVLRLEDAVFSINPVEFVPEEKSRAPRGGRPPRAGGKRPAGAKAE